MTGTILGSTGVTFSDGTSITSRNPSFSQTVTFTGTVGSPSSTITGIPSNCNFISLDFSNLYINSATLDKFYIQIGSSSGISALSNYRGFSGTYNAGFAGVAMASGENKFVLNATTVDSSYPFNGNVTFYRGDSPSSSTYSYAARWKLATYNGIQYNSWGSGWYISSFNSPLERVRIGSVGGQPVAFTVNILAY